MCPSSKPYKLGNWRVTPIPIHQKLLFLKLAFHKVPVSHNCNCRKREKEKKGKWHISLSGYEKSHLDFYLKEKKVRLRFIHSLLHDGRHQEPDSAFSALHLQRLGGHLS